MVSNDILFSSKSTGACLRRAGPDEPAAAESEATAALLLLLPLLPPLPLLPAWTCPPAHLQDIPAGQYP